VGNLERFALSKVDVMIEKQIEARCLKTTLSLFRFPELRPFDTRPRFKLLVKVPPIFIIQLGDILAIARRTKKDKVANIFP
jgi:hypothetical protein